MRIAPLLLSASILSTATLVGAPALAGERGRSPVVIELYTSQGCSGCMQASGYAGELAAREDVLLLSFGVDYWDYLGWKDTFARPEFVERQRAYTARLDNVHPYTPQMVIDGHVNGPGFNKGFVDIAVAFCLEHMEASPPVELTRRDGRLEIEIGDGEAPESAAEVWLVAYEPGEHQVPVSAGENADRVMKTYNVVHAIAKIGGWGGERLSLSAPVDESYSYAVLVQRPDLGAMIAAAVEERPGS